MKLEDGFGDDRFTRRDLVTAIGTGLMASSISDSEALLGGGASSDPQNTALHHLSPEEYATFESLGDALLPGAAAAGIARYVDSQLGREMPLLFIKYMDYPGSYVDFYKEGLKALNRQSQTRYGQPFTALSAESKSELIRDLSQGTPADWEGPPATLFYFVTRNDAIDVYYGTQQGFEKLGIPYLELVRPPSNW